MKRVMQDSPFLYEKIMIQQLAMHREEKRREKNFPNRSEQEHFVWEMLYDNYVIMCEAELRWIQQFREGLEHFKNVTVQPINYFYRFSTG